MVYELSRASESVVPKHLMVPSVAIVHASQCGLFLSAFPVAVCPACLHHSIVCSVLWNVACPPQLVEVAGCNMWVMEETDGPSRDPPQMGHLSPKVHAQQYPASASEKKTTSLSMTGKLLLTQCVQ